MLMRCRLIHLALLALTFSARDVGAYQTGITGYSGKNNGIHCVSCHSGGQTPVVSFSGPTSLQPSQVGTFAFTVTSTDPDVQTGAGFDVAASGGTLQVVNGTVQKERLQSGELTHSIPRANDANDQVTWTFKWKAPAAAGNYTLYGAGNSVNRDGGNSGDRSATNVLSIAVGDVTPLPTASAPISVTPTPTGTATGTGTPTATASAAAPATSTALPADTPTPAPSLSPTSTPSNSATAVATGTSTATTTVPPTATSTETPTETPTPTLTATPTQSETATATMTAALTLTPTLAPTVSPTATPSQTPTSSPVNTATATPTTRRATPGDANCDGAVTAADFPALVTLYSSAGPAVCGADTNQDGSIDTDDVDATIDLIFGPGPAASVLSYDPLPPFGEPQDRIGSLRPSTSDRLLARAQVHAINPSGILAARCRERTV